MKFKPFSFDLYLCLFIENLIDSSGFGFAYIIVYWLGMNDT